MVIQIAKWGNSLAIRIPAIHAKEIGLTENAKADLSVQGGRLVLAPLETSPDFDLDRLIDQITDDNRHDDVGTGRAVGPEFA